MLLQIFSVCYFYLPRVNNQMINPITAATSNTPTQTPASKISPITSQLCNVSSKKIDRLKIVNFFIIKFSLLVIVKKILTNNLPE